jgi:hypothetical protein
MPRKKRQPARDAAPAGSGKRPPHSNLAILLERFGLIPEEDLAALLGIKLKSPRNKPRAELPTFVKAGRRRVYIEESVREFLRRHQSRPDR